MADYGKMNFSVAFNPTSAFPLDARSYFESLDAAEAAAATAEEVGSTNSVYHYGQKLLVKDGSSYKWYEIGADKTLIQDGFGSDGLSVYELIYYDTEPTESQQLIEKATILTIMNDTTDYIVYINYDDGKHPASIYQYGGNIFFYFLHPNNDRWYEISYIPASDLLQYGYTSIDAGGITDVVKYTAQTLNDEQKAQARANIDAISMNDVYEVAQGFTIETLGGIAAPASASEGQFLQYVSGKWAAVTIELAEDGGF